MRSEFFKLIHSYKYVFVTQKIQFVQNTVTFGAPVHGTAPANGHGPLGLRTALYACRKCGVSPPHNLTQMQNRRT